MFNLNSCVTYYMVYPYSTKTYFVFLFLSANCKKLLDSGSITEHDGEMFCNSCYRKNFGPKGYGFGGGAGCLSMDDGKGYTVSLRLLQDCDVILNAPFIY